MLFDEIEKAHSDVFNTLLQILDDGRLTDGHGRTVDFKNTVVIMTSNLGSHWFREIDNEAEIRDRMMETLRAQFRPEFLNRVDEIIIFHSLSREQIGQVVDIQLRILSARLADRHMTINLTGATKDLIVNEGFDPTYGARPLKRTIQRFLENPLSKKILQGEFQQGDSIRIEMEEDRLTFNKK